MTQNLSQANSVDVVESFFGVYLLYSLNPNPRYKGRTYIGYTVDPNRRINQHNKGSSSGGARRTNNRGPWEMVLIVHGFPNDISALRADCAPPVHMPITVGPVCTKKVSSEHRTRLSVSPQEVQTQNCMLCSLSICLADAVSCVVPGCSCVTHITCLARHFLANDTDSILPVEGSCPRCNTDVLWGDIIRKKKGCYKHLSDSPS